MSGEWIKWVKGLSRRREVIVLARKLNMSRREAACACMELWEWADDETHDGHIRGATRDDIDLMLGIAGFSVALEAPEVGWLKVNSSGITFMKWDRNNGESAKRRAMESRKKRRQRELDESEPSRQHRDKSPEPNGTSLLFSGSLPPSLDSKEFRERLQEWIRYKSERRETYKGQGLSSMISRAARLAELHGVTAVMDAMQRAIANHWQGWDQPGSFGGKNNGVGTTAKHVGPGQRYRGD
jgi:hypothetical protein